MKILVAIPCLLTGGTEIQTLGLINALIKDGQEVTVACYFEFNPSMVEKYKEAGVREIKLFSADGSRTLGIKNTVLHLWKGLRKAVRDVRPDVAHVQYMAPGALPILILRTLGVRKIVATAHTPGDIYSNNGLKLLRFLTNNVLSGFQCITTRAEMSFFGKSDSKNKKHFTIYNCLPEYVEIGERQTDNKKSNLTIGVVSRLEPIKGMDLVIPAFLAVHKRFPSTRLLVVGDGSLRSEMDEVVRKREIESECIEFAGRQPQERLQDFYDRIDILLMPSRSEGFGLTAVEGMARGCVPVVSDTGGLPEVIQDGINGLLHKPEDINDMVDKICLLIENREKLAAMSKEAIKRAADFSVEKYNTAIAKWYDSLKEKNL